MNVITSRKKSRKFLFQKLFSETYNQNDKDQFDEAFLIDSFRWNLDEDYLSEMEKLIKSRQSELLELLKICSPKFSPDKMDLMYVIPIFIWATEMLYFSWEIPAKVSINEAIEISKIYWADTSKKIVNWVLNQLYKNFDEIKLKLENIKDKSEFSFFVNY